MQFLLLGAKARAMLQGRFHASIDDIKAVALPVLRHRVITNFNAESAGITSDKVISRLLEEIPAVEKAMRSRPSLPPRLPKSKIHGI